jgi:hypothetical protein
VIIIYNFLIFNGLLDFADLNLSNDWARLLLEYKDELNNEWDVEV